MISAFRMERTSIQRLPAISEKIIRTPTYNSGALVHHYTPNFIRHGSQENIVDVSHGEKAASTLQSLNLSVDWKVCEHQEHW